MTGGAAACGGGETCGAGDAPTQGVTVSTQGQTVTYGNFSSGANNDCPAPGSPTSLSLQGSQVSPPGAFAFTLCFPRPDQLGGDTAMNDDGLVQIVDVRGEDAQGCMLNRDSNGAVTGTMTLSGYCDSGNHPDGYAISFSATLAGTRTCPSQAAVPVTLTIGGEAAVEAIVL